MKPSDVWCFGACRKHHRESEKREAEFGKEHGLDLYSLCLEYAAQSPDKAIKEAAKHYARALPPYTQSSAPAL